MCREHCILIVLFPEVSQAIFLDSSRINDPNKDYVELKKVLDSALCGWGMRGGNIRKKIRKSGKMGFAYKTDFTCLTQPPKCSRDAYYVMFHMHSLIAQHQKLLTEAELTKWGKDAANRSVDALRDNLCDIQHTLGSIIYQSVVNHEGVFHVGNLKRLDIADRLEKQGDTREFNTICGILPLQEKPSKKTATPSKCGVKLA